MPFNLGPYKYQRDRQIGNKQPRPPQPAYQPNKKPRVEGWGLSPNDYWQKVFEAYLRDRRLR